MIYLDGADLKSLGLDWDALIAAVAGALDGVARGDYHQPLKPYLRYGDPSQRIIAMPAYVGGAIRTAGIKWIASFPRNLERGLPRAHSVTILNEADTGVPCAIINTPLVSAARTAAVSGLFLRRALAERPRDRYRLGLCGFGPIGQLHLAMCQALLGERLERVTVHDVRPVDLPAAARLASSWRDAYDDADLFITCTTSAAGYIDARPRPGSVHLNVSLRDYATSTGDWFRGGIVVDDWNEVCREGTDIARLAEHHGLREGDVHTLAAFVQGQAPVDPATPLFFNPMGMGVFDIAVAAHFVALARASGRGTLLPEGEA